MNRLRCEQGRVQSCEREVEECEGRYVCAEGGEEHEFVRKGGEIECVERGKGVCVCREGRE